MFAATTVTPAASASRWHALAARVLDDHQLTADEGLAILRSDDERTAGPVGGRLSRPASLVRQPRGSELSDQRQERPVRRRLRLLLAIAGVEGRDSPLPRWSPPRKSSKAPEGPPSRRPKPTAPSSPAARPAIENSTRSARSCREIKATYGLKVCFSVGLLTLEQARRLKAAGVDRINHNLNTSQRFYPRICTTHSYQDRLETLRNVRQAGLEICSGGIVGMGEEDADVVELALRLGELRAEAVPVNFLLPIPGMPLEGRRPAQPPLLPEGPGPVPAGQSALRAADRGRPRGASRPAAAAGPVRGQLDVRRRLPDRPGGKPRKKTTA